MSQIDKLNYIPLLFWFLILFCFLYFYLVLYVLPFIFGALRVRVLFLNYLVEEVFGWAFFRGCFSFAFFSESHSSLVAFLLGFLGAFVYLDFFFFFFNGFLGTSAGSPSSESSLDF